ncbi:MULTISPECIES: hypothetical protein [unclassified Corallococcus]|uniref:hypothetical protein n=1 Tax=unclassified Corallococcus TaxID=2685029 RepID=UPI001A8F04F5|nr:MULTISPECIES: hypothetical protein [unclassified Corallococcus]MBN9687144.1 hypothetical protein [Corallococcus sp. NCSPR001]WAS89029.1 hypothetical protein O0N60_19100 [Corallococcus sp. NCRR]
MRHACRRDANEKPIVQALRLAGWTVERVNATGFPDLVCVRRGQVLLLEVKAAKRGRMMPAQVELHARLRAAGLAVAIVTSPEEALAATRGEVVRTALDVRAERRPGKAPRAAAGPTWQALPEAAGATQDAPGLPTPGPGPSEPMAGPPRPPRAKSEGVSRPPKSTQKDWKSLAKPASYPAKEEP